MTDLLQAAKEVVRQISMEHLSENAVESLRQAISKAEQAYVCNWSQSTYDDAECNAWQSDCGQYWAITEGTPTENGIRFCHACGKLIKENKFADDEDE